MAVDERGSVRVQRPHLVGRQRRQHGPPAGGEVGRQPDPDVGDQWRPPGCSLLDDVQHVAAVQHRQVRALPQRVGQCGQRTSGDPLERCLPAVAAAHLERRDPEPVAVLVGEMGDEALVLHRPHQVVGRRAGQPDRRREPVEADRVRLAGEVAQHAQRPGGGGDVGHGSASVR